MTLGEKLLKLRQKSGLSQDKVAEMLNVSRQAVSKWERDEAMPDVDKIIGLSNLFNVTTDYLLKEQPKEERQQATTYRPDFFQRVLEFIKKKWYYAGYALGAWGLLDLLKVLVTRVILNTIFGDFTSMMNESIGADTISSATFEATSPAMEPALEMGLSSVFNTPMKVLWLPIIFGLLKLATGILIVVFGKRYMKNRQAQRY